MAGFWDQFGRSAVSSMQQSSPIGAEIFRDKKRREELAQQAAQNRILQVLQFAQKQPIGQRDFLKGIDVSGGPGGDYSPVKEGLLNETVPNTLDADAIQKRLIAFTNLPQKKRLSTLQEMKTMGEDKTLGQWFPVFEVTAQAPDKEDFKIVGDGQTLLKPNPETGQMEAVWHASKGQQLIGVNQDTNTLRVYDKDEGRIINIQMGEYTTEDVEGGMVVQKEIGPEGTRLSEYTRGLVDEMWKSNKLKNEAELAKATGVSGDKIPAGLSQKYNGYKLAQKELAFIQNMIHPDANATAQAKKDAEAIIAYMGGGIGGAVGRAMQSEKGTAGTWKQSPAVTRFKTHLGMLRDIRQRSESGAALPESEKEFYEDLIGGTTIELDYLVARFDALNQMLGMGIQSMFETGSAVRGTPDAVDLRSMSDEELEQALKQTVGSP